MFQDLKPYDRYGAQAHEWVPEFPAAWAVAPGAGVLSEVRSRNDGLRETTVLSLSYGRVIVKPTDKLHGLVPASYETYQVLEPGDIVFRPTDLQNDQRSIRVGAVEDRGIITSAYIGLRPRGIEPKFAYLYLRALDYLKVFYGMGSGLRQNIDFGDFKRLPIPVPPVDEQRAIVTYLAHANDRINEAIATKRQLVALARESKRAITQNYVRSGLEAHVSVRDSGIPWVGAVPAHWEIRRIANVFDNLDYRRIPLATEVRGRMTERRFDYYGASGVIDQVADYIFDEPTILIAEDGANLVLRNLPLAIKAEGKYWVNNHAHVLRPRFGEIDYYIALLESIDYRPWISGAAQPKLTQDRLKSVSIAVPPVNEQAAIVRQILRETSVLDQMIARTSDEIGLLNEFRTRLTADIVMGQLDVRSIAATLPPIEFADVFGLSAGAVEAEEDEMADDADMEDG